MPSHNEFKELAKTMLLNAKALFDKRLYDGSIYLAGYVLEFALKARICKILDLDDYPESGEISKACKTHNYDTLVKLAGLEKKLDNAKSSNSALYNNWSILTKWSEEFRYKPIGTNKMKDAQDVINALENPQDGIFTWIKKRW